MLLQLGSVWYLLLNNQLEEKDIKDNEAFVDNNDKSFPDGLASHNMEGTNTENTPGETKEVESVQAS